MNTSNMKNMIVLKDLPSNLVEEAIIILKANVNAKSIDKKRENVKVVAGGTSKRTKDYIVKEAENVVASYISSIEKPKQLEITNNKLKKKYKLLQKLTAFFAVTAVLAIVVNLI